MLDNEPELELSIIVTVVSGESSVRDNLTELIKQVDFSTTEMIVPFDEWSLSVGLLASEFPEVRFHFIDDLGFTCDPDAGADQHRLYDRRRAVGLRLSKGRLIAMTEDHAMPADDWIKQTVAAHEQPYDVIGGAVENGVDLALNRAWYYCDFGRYGRPFKSGEASYVSDVNVAYKRSALAATYDLWHEFYQETTVHWGMASRGMKVFLDDSPVVFQMRPPLSLGRALKERVNWGRVFAETRANNLSPLYRLGYATGTIFLPLIMCGRVMQHMLRQKQTAVNIISTLPIVLLLLVAWSSGEFLGYFTGKPEAVGNVSEVF